MTATLANRPYRNYRFKVTILGDVLHCSEINGFDATFDVVEYREGDFKSLTPLKMPGLIKYGNVTVKYGTTSSVAIYNWLNDIRERNSSGNASTTDDMRIDLIDEDGTTVVASWELKNAWPVKYTAPDFNATASEVAYESIEFAHEGLSRLEGEAGTMGSDDTAASAGYLA